VCWVSCTAWASRSRPRASKATIASATRCSGSTSSTPPAAMASLGMPKTTQVSSFCAMVRAPLSCSSFMPRAPSSPMPVRMMASASRPAQSAAERNSTSTDGLWRLTGGPSSTTAKYWPPALRSCRWRPPGAISATPRSSRSPSRASRTFIAHRPSSRCAYMAVNFSGMCCTMAMPGLSAGSDSSTCSMACVPPVELPITTGLLTDSACSRWPAAVAAGRAAGAAARGR
jgi:hypothetical protein